jgi:hypothetical protein
LLSESGLPARFSGQFVHGPEFDTHRSVFEAALNLATQYDDSVCSGVCDYALWKRLKLAYGQINQLSPSFAEIAQEIEEFAILPNWRVDVTLKRPRMVI